MQIQRENVLKFLGAHIDESLSWKRHIDIVSSKTPKSISILYKSTDVWSKLYYHKDRYTHASPLLDDMRALNLKLNIFNILRFMHKGK